LDRKAKPILLEEKDIMIYDSKSESIIRPFSTGVVRTHSNQSRRGHKEGHWMKKRTIVLFPSIVIQTSLRSDHNSHTRSFQFSSVQSVIRPVISNNHFGTNHINR
jgi:hypothetical protein